MNITPGDTIAIQGLGGLGHLAVQYARKMGYRTVALSSSDSKRDFAMELGANYYIDTSKENAAEALQRMGGASCIIVTAPNPEIMGPLVNGLAPMGKLLLLAGKSFSGSCFWTSRSRYLAVGDVPINTAALIAKGLSVWGWPAGHSLDCEEAIDFAEKQGVRCMVEKFPLDKVEDAVNRMESGNLRFRSVIVME